MNPVIHFSYQLPNSVVILILKLQVQINAIRPTTFKTCSPQQLTGSKVIDLTDDDDRQTAQKTNSQQSIAGKII